MTKNYRLELDATTSQVLGSPQSASVPSEPLDIQNWFSSYSYESPELDTSDCFGDCDGSRRSEIGLTKCNDSPGFAGFKSAAEVLGSLDSILLPSEPPDIKNWFSSYVYESLELNTLDGFKDCDGSRGSDIANGDHNLSENETVGERNHACLAGEKGSSHGPHRPADLKYAAEVPVSSDTFSFYSEPPDIKNWFSSFVDESPPLSGPVFKVLDTEEREVDEVNVAQESNRKIKDEIRDYTEAGKSSDLLDQSIKSAMIVKCNSLVKDEHQLESTREDSPESSRKQSSSVLNDFTSEWTSQEISRGQRPLNHNQEVLRWQRHQNLDHGLVEEYGKSKADDRDHRGKSDCKFVCTFPDKSPDTKTNLDNQDGESLQKLIETEDSEGVRPKSTLSSAALEEKTSKRSTKQSNEKENEGTAFEENGFISTRKSRGREAINDNTERLCGVQSESLRNSVTFASKGINEAKTSRKALCEITNFQHPTKVIESRGKWHCPQKRKQDLGPPLKQLRLEQWIRPS